MPVEQITKVVSIRECGHNDPSLADLIAELEKPKEEPQ